MAPPQTGRCFPSWLWTAALAGRSDGEFNITRSSPCLSPSRCSSMGNDPLPAFVPIITPLPLLRCGFVKPNCKSAWLRLLAIGAEGSRRTFTTRGESSFALQALDAPRTKTAPKKRQSRIIKNRLFPGSPITSATNPPVPSHRAPENTWPARDTFAPWLHTSRKPRCGRRHGRPAWCAVRRCRRPRRSPF